METRSRKKEAKMTRVITCRNGDKIEKERSKNDQGNYMQKWRQDRERKKQKRLG